LYSFLFSPLTGNTGKLKSSQAIPQNPFITRKTNINPAPGAMSTRILK